MIAVHLVTRAQWETQLRALKCKPFVGTNPLKTVEIWETEDGLLFLVPIDNPEGKLRSDDLNTVKAQIALLKPTEYE
jgi:hypothetical protein